MASCEKCWADSRRAGFAGGDSLAEYHRLLEARDCTPEEQAGPDATWCAECRQQTVHQYARVCMICGQDTGFQRDRRATCVHDVIWGFLIQQHTKDNGDVKFNPTAAGRLPGGGPTGPIR